MTLYKVCVNFLLIWNPRWPSQNDIFFTCDPMGILIDIFYILIVHLLYIYNQWMISYKILIIMFIWNPRWPPPQDKFVIEPYVKFNVVHLTGIVLYWTSVKCMFFLLIGFPRWLPQQNIGPLWENKHFMTVMYALVLIDWLIFVI